MDYVAVTPESSTNMMGSSRTGKAFQSCPELSQGGQASLPLHQSVIGCDTGEEGRSLNQVWLPSAKYSLWRGAQLTAVEVQYRQQLGSDRGGRSVGGTPRYPLIEPRAGAIGAGGPGAVRAEEMSQLSERHRSGAPT